MQREAFGTTSINADSLEFESASDHKEKVMDNYHITKTDGSWALKKEGADRASKTAEITAVA